VAEDTLVASLLSRLSRAERRRDEIAGLVDDAYDYVLPLRERLQSRRDPRAAMGRVFDGTAIASLQNTASRLLFELAPPTEPWFELRAGPDVPEEEKDEVDRRLKEVTDEIRRVISNSDFYTQAHEALLDSLVSVGLLRIDIGDAVRPVRFRAIPMARVVPDVGPFGTLDAYFFRHRPRAGQITTIWPRASLTEALAEKASRKPDEEVEIVEAIWRDWSVRGTETWRWLLLEPKEKRRLDQSAFEGHGAAPVIGFRWSAAPDEAYGHGPVLMALPDIRTLNLTKQLVLENADLAVSGAWQAEDDGTVNFDTVQIIPGTVIRVAPGSSGLKPLETPGRFDVAQLVIEDLRAQIKATLLDDDLGPPEGTPMSATEVMQRKADQAERVAAPLGRYLKEFLFPVVHRVAHVLRQVGRIELPPIDGRLVALRPLSPLARAQAQEEILRHDRWVEMMNLRFGPQQTALALKVDEYGAWLARHMGVDPRLVRDAAERRQITEAIAAMAADQGQQAQEGP